jgi:hypothetical protein
MFTTSPHPASSSRDRASSGSASEPVDRSGSTDGARVDEQPARRSLDRKIGDSRIVLEAEERLGNRPDRFRSATLAYLAELASTAGKGESVERSPHDDPVYQVMRAYADIHQGALLLGQELDMGEVARLYAAGAHEAVIGPSDQVRDASPMLGSQEMEHKGGVARPGRDHKYRDAHAVYEELRRTSSHDALVRALLDEERYGRMYVMNAPCTQWKSILSKRVRDLETLHDRETPETDNAALCRARRIQAKVEWAEGLFHRTQAPLPATRSVDSKRQAASDPAAMWRYVETRFNAGNKPFAQAVETAMGEAPVGAQTYRSLADQALQDDVGELRQLTGEQVSVRQLEHLKLAPRHQARGFLAAIADYHPDGPSACVGPLNQPLVHLAATKFVRLGVGGAEDFHRRMLSGEYGNPFTDRLAVNQLATDLLGSRTENFGAKLQAVRRQQLACWVEAGRADAMALVLRHPVDGAMSLRAEIARYLRARADDWPHADAVEAFARKCEADPADPQRGYGIRSDVALRRMLTASARHHVLAEIMRGVADQLRLDVLPTAAGTIAAQMLGSSRDTPEAVVSMAVAGGLLALLPGQMDELDVRSPLHPERSSLGALTSLAKMMAGMVVPMLGVTRMLLEGEATTAEQGDTSVGLSVSQVALWTALSCLSVIASRAAIAVAEGSHSSTNVPQWFNALPTTDDDARTVLGLEHRLPQRQASHRGANPLDRFVRWVRIPVLSGTLPVLRGFPRSRASLADEGILQTVTGFSRLITDAFVQRDRRDGLPTMTDLASWPLAQGEYQPAVQLPHGGLRDLETSEYRFPQVDEFQPYTPDLHLRVREGSGRAGYREGSEDDSGKDQKARKAQ